eukprot:SAG31_NODE_15101_length_771_cov_0.916667_2_plen_204_part_01
MENQEKFEQFVEVIKITGIHSLNLSNIGIGPTAAKIVGKMLLPTKFSAANTYEMEEVQKITTCNYSQDGQWLCLGRGDSTASLVDAKTGRPKKLLKGVHWDAITSACFSPDSQTLCLASLDKTASLIDLTTGQPLYKFDRTGSKEITSVDFSPVVCYGCLTTPGPHARACPKCKSNSLGSIICLGSKDGAAVMLNARSGKILHV